MVAQERQPPIGSAPRAGPAHGANGLKAGRLPVRLGPPVDGSTYFRDCRQVLLDKAGSGTNEPTPAAEQTITAGRRSVNIPLYHIRPPRTPACVSAVSEIDDPKRLPPHGRAAAGRSARPSTDGSRRTSGPVAPAGSAKVANRKRDKRPRAGRSYEPRDHTCTTVALVSSGPRPRSTMNRRRVALSKVMPPTFQQGLPLR